MKTISAKYKKVFLFRLENNFVLLRLKYSKKLQGKL